MNGRLWWYLDVCHRLPCFLQKTANLCPQWSESSVQRWGRGHLVELEREHSLYLQNNFCLILLFSCQHQSSLSENTAAKDCQETILIDEKASKVCAIKLSNFVREEETALNLMLKQSPVSPGSVLILYDDQTPPQQRCYSGDPIANICLGKRDPAAEGLAM